MIVERMLYDHGRFTLRDVCGAPRLAFVMGDVDNALYGVKVYGSLRR